MSCTDDYAMTGDSLKPGRVGLLVLIDFRGEDAAFGKEDCGDFGKVGERPLVYFGGGDFGGGDFGGEES